MATEVFQIDDFHQDDGSVSDEEFELLPEVRPKEISRPKTCHESLDEPRGFTSGFQTICICGFQSIFALSFLFT